VISVAGADVQAETTSSLMGFDHGETVQCEGDGLLVLFAESTREGVEECQLATIITPQDQTELPA